MAKKEDESKEEAEPAELKPSELDEITHAEMRVLYEESSAAARFALERQWKLVGAVLLVFAAMMLAAHALVIDALIAKGLVLASFVVSAAAIYMLIVYQVWQNSEFARQEVVGARFSSLFTAILGSQGKREGRVHGYIILVFMIVGIILGNAAAVFFLSRFYL